MHSKTTTSPYPVGFRERAVQMGIDHLDGYARPTAAVRDIAGELGGSPDSLRVRSNRARRDTGPESRGHTARTSRHSGASRPDRGCRSGSWCRTGPSPGAGNGACRRPERGAASARSGRDHAQLARPAETGLYPATRRAGFVDDGQRLQPAPPQTDHRRPSRSAIRAVRAPSPLRGGSERGAPPPAPRARSGRNR